MSNQLKTLIADVLEKLAFEKLNPMQDAVIHEGVKGNDLMLLSPTGSGKTLAFLTVLLHQLNSKKSGVQAMVVVPSRELALQIETVFRALKSNWKVTCCYGGHSVKSEQNSLAEAPAVIIGTPGRIVDHITRNSVDISYVSLVVLDEFDKSLQLGFQSQMEYIFDTFKSKPQRILTSATGIDAIPDFVKGDYSKLDFRTHQEVNLSLSLVRTPSDEKVETLMHLVKSFNQEPTLVFCNHRDAVERISALLSRHHFDHGIFHGALEQIDREKSLIKFRGGAHNVLIATDLASRGLDIPEIRHVVHYQCPIHHSEFLHRNGRTARMHADGSAYLILADDESMPEYLDKKLPVLKVNPFTGVVAEPDYVCVYISAGKKDKISKGDVVGFLTKIGGLTGADIGLIAIIDNATYVAVKRNKTNAVLRKLKDQKIKKIRVKVEEAF